MFTRFLQWLLVPTALVAAGGDHSFRLQRLQMVEQQLVRRDITEEKVLQAMRTVHRHHFVPEEQRAYSYQDTPLPIGYDQTISQPYIVAFMTQALDVEPDHRVFELGTGSGYQAAVLAELVDEVYTVEIVPQLARRAEAILDSLDYDNVHVRAGDGWMGWPEAAPFDRMLLTAAAPEIPDQLIEQLRPGGRIVLPLGEAGAVQDLVLLQKREDGELIRRELLSVRFVPVTGDH